MQINNQIRSGAMQELARRDFFSFCEVTTPNFYKPERSYLVELANEFQKLYEDDTNDVLVVNVPP